MLKIKSEPIWRYCNENTRTIKRHHGILSPILLRPIENTEEYEVISGHRRLHAAMKAGMSEVPASIFPVTRDEAAIMLVDSNLHREHILPSEKAFAYKLKLDAIKRQGKRTDLTSRQVVGKLESADYISETESGRQVQRYIRLTNLIPELLDMMDEDKIAFSVGVELSYLDEETQYDLLNAIEMYDCTPSYSQANHMHKSFIEGTLTVQSIESMLKDPKPNQRDMIKLPVEKIQKYCKSADSAQLEDYVMRAIDHYGRYLNRQRRMDREER